MPYRIAGIREDTLGAAYWWRDGGAGVSCSVTRLVRERYRCRMARICSLSEAKFKL